VVAGDEHAHFDWVFFEFFETFVSWCLGVPVRCKKTVAAASPATRIPANVHAKAILISTLQPGQNGPNTTLLDSPRHNLMQPSWLYSAAPVSKPSPNMHARFSP
jgi:hypothetical protein